jgi:hypothetical protein
LPRTDDWPSNTTHQEGRAKADEQVIHEDEVKRDTRGLDAIFFNSFKKVSLDRCSKEIALTLES